MKAPRIALLALLLASTVAGAASAGVTSVAAQVHIGPSGRSTIDLGFFYDDLAPYGRWVQSRAYGWVWTPEVASSWHPYCYGHWVYTDQGWLWISDEPFGWATYHYGRWVDDPELGWAWVPGYEWAPSWVAFQAGHGYFGWAPLPPAVSFRAGALRVSLAPATYVFVPERYFLAPRVVDYAVPRRQVLPIYRTTRDVTAYRFAGDRISTYGVPVHRIREVVRRPVPRYELAGSGPAPRRHAMRVQGNRIEVFRPRVNRVKVAPPHLRATAGRQVVTRQRGRSARERTTHPPGHGRPTHLRQTREHPPGAFRSSRVRPSPRPRPHSTGRIHSQPAPRGRARSEARVHGGQGPRIRAQAQAGPRTRRNAGPAARRHAQESPRQQPHRRGGQGHSRHSHRPPRG